MEYTPHAMLRRDPGQFQRAMNLAKQRFRVDDATKERLRREGYATAYNELLGGHAGYLFTHCDGMFIAHVDKNTGLPVYSTGDMISAATGIWQHGFETATKDFTKKHGPPWNSHLGFLNELADIKAYFSKRSFVDAPIGLTMGEPPHAGPEAGLTIQLVDGEGLRTGHGGPHIRLTSERLYSGALRVFASISSSGKTGTDPLVEPEGTPASPRVKPGTKFIFLRFYSLAQQITFFWGPQGSRLCFFRFDGVIDLRRPNQPGTEYAALDLCLGDWIPSMVPGLTKEPWQK